MNNITYLKWIHTLEQLSEPELHNELEKQLCLEVQTSHFIRELEKNKTLSRLSIEQDNLAKLQLILEEAKEKIECIRYIRHERKNTSALTS